MSDYFKKVCAKEEKHKRLSRIQQLPTPQERKRSFHEKLRQRFPAPFLEDYEPFEDDPRVDEKEAK